MRVRGIGQARKLAQHLRTRFATHAIILAYHRIAHADSDPWGLCVSGRHFAEHLEVLRRRGPVLSMRELAARLGAGTIPYGTVAVTFDDGYADNLFNAKPLLERFGIPATVFVASGHVGGTAEFWWDRLQGLVLEPGTLPRRFRLERDGICHECDLGDAAQYEDPDYHRNRSWRAWDSPPTARHELYCALWRILRPLPAAAQHEVLGQLAVWAGVRNGYRPEYRAVSETELRALSRGGLLEIGAHTMTHPLLSILPAAIQHREIAHSRATLERIVGEPVVSFAYPYGERSQITASIVARIGFASAVTTDAGAASARTPRFELPRLAVTDVDGDRFSAWLDRQFAAV
jgi:peptidoglycan/xylan/chitin deacetylase (PgdA/CDA1 family)